MPEIRTVEEAKEFIISKLILEAKRDAVPLSEVEERMLHFSATQGNSAQVLEASELFDLEYDREVYEMKILALSRGFQSRAGQTQKKDLQTWKQAVRALRGQDHYLAVLIDPRLAATGLRQNRGVYPPWPRLARLIVLGFVGFLVVSACLLVYLLKFNTH